MSRPFDGLDRWVYRGIWGILARWFRVPEDPPALPAAAGEPVQQFRPAPAYLTYLKLQYWLGLVPNLALIGIGWVALLVTVPPAGLLAAPLAAMLAFVVTIPGFIALHLRFDTTWYVMSGRSMRIRRGIWVLHETTITFENIQNVMVQQGPLQRWFGIADLIVDTAGGGRGRAESETAGMTGHRGLLEGVANADEIRELLLGRLRNSRSGGLGDEPEERRLPPPPMPGLGRAHLEALAEIRDGLRAAAGVRTERHR